MLDKSKINQLFRNLRNRGFIARQNFSCCRGCAGYKIANLIDAMPDEKRNQFTGAVFYTMQDNEHIKRGSCFIAYGPINIDTGQVGLSALEIGNIIAQECRHVGLNYKWNGEANSRIMLTDKEIGHEND